MTSFSIQKLWVLTLVFLFMLGLPAYAQDNVDPDAVQAATVKPVLIELFTASDCSACIFADRMLYDAMQDDNVIALSCKIKDQAELKNWQQGATPKSAQPLDPCTLRQWAYTPSRRTGEAIMRIPEFVINGGERIKSNGLGEFLRRVNVLKTSYMNEVQPVLMRWKDRDTVTLYLPEDPKRSQSTNASVWIVRYKDIVVEKIESGANKGRVLRFSNVVQDTRHVGKWHGDMRSIEVDVTPPKGGKERGGYVTIVAELMGEDALAAGKLADYALPSDKKPAKKATP